MEGQCKFCRDHEPGDTIYEEAGWDGGYGFDFINNIKYCPLCGAKLLTYEQKTSKACIENKELYGF